MITERIDQLLETSLRSWQSRVSDSYHPELEDTPTLIGSDITKYQMPIGSQLDHHVRKV